MANVLHGNASGNQLNAAENRTQVYGLKGDDTLTSDGKSAVLLVGGAGDDSLIMMGGTGTLSGGDGADIFEFTYSATKPLSVVIEDLEPSEDKIIVNFDGNTAPQISSSTSDNDVILRDGNRRLNITLKGVRDNDYLDSEISEEAWEVLRLTNDVRETNGKSLLTASDGLTAGAQVRAQEISDLAETGALSNHTRPDNKGEWYTVLDGKYNFPGENLEAGASSPVEVVEKWMDSEAHKKNILDERFQKLGVGYNYYDGGSESSHRYHWTQLFADKLNIAETVPAADLLTVAPEVHTVSKAVTLTEGDDTYSNNEYGATIAALGGNDSIENYNLLVSVSGGADSDTIYNYDGRDVTLSGGAGDDLILTRGDFVTVNGGTGDDLIGLADNNAKYNVIEYTVGDGNDTIGAFSSTSTLKISGAEYTPVTVGTDVRVSVGNDLINILKGAYLPNLNIEGTRSKLYMGTAGANYMNNNVEGATLRGLGGNDTLINWVSNSTISGDADNDSIRNYGASALLHGGDGNDYLNNAMPGQCDVTIYGGAGNDSIFNNMLSNKVTISGGTGDDSIQNASWNVSIDGDLDNDYILNSEYGFDNMIEGNFGNDTITNHGNDSTIYGGDDNDLINNDGERAIIDGDFGNDVVNNYSGSVLIELSSGNDSVYNEGSNVTIYGGLDNDLIILSNDAQNNLIRCTARGRDTIVGLNETDTLNIGSGTGTYSTVESGDNLIVNVGTGSILLWHSASLSAVNIEGTLREVGEQNERDNYISLTENPDEYTNTLEGAVIFALGGADSITNQGGNVAILGGADDDYVDNSGRNVIIFGEEGEDFFFNVGDNVSIIGDEDADSVINLGDNVLIFGGSENDTIYSSGSNEIIIGSLGDDSITLEYFAQNNLLEYTTGDGFDTIIGFKDSDTLKLITASSNYSTQISGNDVIVNVGSEFIKLLEVWDSEEDLEPVVNIVVTSDGSSVEEKYIPLTEGDDNYKSYADGVTIAALGGADSVENYGSNVSLNGGNDNDTLNNHGSSSTLLGGAGEDSINNRGSNVIIDGGDNNDNVYNSGSLVTINTSEGNDSIRNSADTVSISSGTGNDTIYNGYLGDGGGDNVTIQSGAGDDSILNYGVNVSIDAGDGKDHIDNFRYNVTVDAGGNDDYISSWFSDCSIIGGAGDDTVWNTGDNTTIDGGTGDDDIDNSDANEIVIYGGAGNDSITSEGSNVTITGGLGNDRISLKSSAQNNLIQYTPGDGKDSIWGFDENNRLQIGDGTGTYSTQTSGDDIVINVGSGSITLINFRGRPEQIIIGESGTEGGGSGNNGGGNGGSSSGSGDGGRGGNDGGNVSGGTSANEGMNSDASGGRSAVGSRGRSSSTNSNTSGGTVRVRSRNSRLNLTTPVEHIEFPNILTPSTQQTTATTQPTANQRVYAGGNQVVGDYQSGEKIIFGDVYTGSFYDAAGNYCVGSSTGALVIQNAADKVIDLSDAAGNSFIKAYSATTAGIIDGRGLTGFEIINGSAGADAIFAGDGGSQLWGGVDVVADIMVGGGGTDIFIGGRTQGADVILNSSSADIVHLNDATLSDIIATEENNGAIAVAFNTGNVVGVQSSEALSATFMLADGSAYRYNHANKSWQTA